MTAPRRLALIFHGDMVALGTPSELKRGSMRGELLLVECEPLGDAVEALLQAPGVVDAAVFGNALHLVVADADGASASGGVAGAGQGHGLGPLIQAPIGGTVAGGVVEAVFLHHRIVGLVGGATGSRDIGAVVQVLGHPSLRADHHGAVGIAVADVRHGAIADGGIPGGCAG